ncbi:MAG: Calx-beta domain-containing protein [Candidatus Sumerlaeia bacterium]|nr:Calx-beta domain-containing protein [Candidatus Sumerlaeia bacterium]
MASTYHFPRVTRTRLRRALAAAAAFAALAAAPLQAQTVLLSEDFSTASGTTPPLNWTNNDLVGSSGLWEFSNSRPFTVTAVSPPFAGNFAAFDSDGLGLSGGEDTALESAAFDATGAASVKLKFDHHFRSGFGGAWEVEVFNGTAWVAPSNPGQAASGTATVGANTTSTITAVAAADIDITTEALAAGAACRVRFRWTGDFSWWWLVDNVRVEGNFGNAVNVANLSQAEGSGGGTTPFNFAVTATPAPTDNFTVDYTITPVGSTDSTDISTPFTGTFTFTADGVATSRNFTVDVFADSFPEADEAFTVTFSNLVNAGSGAAFLNDGVANGTIQDDDFTCGATQDFATASGTTPPAGWTVVDDDTFGVVWEFQNPVSYSTTTYTTTAPIVAPFAIADSDAAGNGSTGDTSLVSPSVAVTGEFAKVAFDVQYRDVGDPAEFLAVEWSPNGTTWNTVATFNASTPATASTGGNLRFETDTFPLGSATNLQVRFRYVSEWAWFAIIDNIQICQGSLPAGIAQVSVADASAAEGAGDITFTVTVDPPNTSGAAISLEYETSNGTATEPGDYTATSGILNIPSVAGPAAQTFTIDVPVAQDTLLEGAETFTMTLSNLSDPFNALFGDDVATGTITDDDFPPPANFALAEDRTLRRFVVVDTSNAAKAGLSGFADPADFYNGGDFNGSNLDEFVAWNGNTGNLETINPDTGAITTGPPLTGLPTDFFPIDFEYNFANDQMYILLFDFNTFAAGRIGTVNLSTGVYTNIATTLDFTALAIDPAGNGYAAGFGPSPDFDNDFYTLNVATGASTLVAASVAANTGFFFAWDYDPLQNRILAAYLDSTAGTDLVEFDPSTGAATNLGQLTATERYRAFGVRLDDSPASASKNWMMLE